MERGDIVEVRGWNARWNGTVGLVYQVGPEFVRIRLISTPDLSVARYYANQGAGFYPDNLKILGHIDVAPSEGEERCAEGT